ncbi:MAG: hypothetical protein R3181_15510 [Rubricoccaceae bacterium]|nr:hypothetical protein [Rubricoccaceae bacterium]
MALLLLLIVLAALAASLRWVWRDARRRGHDPRLALTVALLCWPLGLSLWLMIRSGRHLAPRGWGSPWG